MIPTLKAKDRAPAGLRIGDERGVALILALLVTLALSALTASLMLTSRTETFSGMNYRLLAQTRYGAEAGMHQTVNYLLNNYTPPGGAVDPLANYDTTVSPVTYNGNPVVLSSMAGVAANYPVASVVTGFQTGTAGMLADGAFTVNYASLVTLLTMRQVNVYGSTTPVTIMTWQVTADGSVGSRNATQEVSAVLEQQFARPFNYGVFADAVDCNTLGFSGGGIVDSYDSTSIVLLGSNVVTQAGGNAGTNGSVGASPNTTIHGSLFIPRAGVSTCGASGPGPAYPTVTGGIVELPQTIPYPSPSAPNPMPPTGSVNLNTACGTTPGCSLVGDGVKLAPGSYADLTISGPAVLHLASVSGAGGGNFTINSVTLGGSSQVSVDASLNPIIVNVGGQGKATPIDFTGGTVVNNSLNPSNLQIQYAGTGQITLTGSNRAAGLIYAPNASVILTGGTDWFGSIVARTFDDPGGVSLHFDRHLQGSPFFTPGNWVLNSFTWKTY